MRRIDRLKREARESATFAGHDMGRFLTTPRYYPDGPTDLIAIAWCKDCRAYVQVMVKPMPNEIDISGDVFGRSCVFAWR